MQTYATNATNDGFGDNANLPREFEPWVIEQVERKQKEREEAYSRWETEHRRCADIYRMHWNKWKNSELVPRSKPTILLKLGKPMPWKGRKDGYCWGYVFHMLQIMQRVDTDQITQHWYPIGKKIDGDYRIEHKRSHQQKTNAGREYNVMLHLLCPWWCPNCGGQTFPGCGRALLLAPSEKEQDETKRIAHQKEDAMRDIKNASWKKAHCKAKMEAAKKAKIALASSADKSSSDVATAIKVFETSKEAYDDADNAFEGARASLSKILREAKQLLWSLERQKRIGN